jgi:hypothetical protein
MLHFGGECVSIALKSASEVEEPSIPLPLLKIKEEYRHSNEEHLPF